jgi:hypothetical protein
MELVEIKPKSILNPDTFRLEIRRKIEDGLRDENSYFSALSPAIEQLISNNYYSNAQNSAFHNAVLAVAKVTKDTDSATAFVIAYEESTRIHRESYFRYASFHDSDLSEERVERRKNKSTGLSALSIWERQEAKDLYSKLMNDTATPEETVKFAHMNKVAGGELAERLEYNQIINAPPTPSVSHLFTDYSRGETDAKVEMSVQHVNYQTGETIQEKSSIVSFFKKLFK